ncbi:MAG: UDP-2,3-diacylglucosamine diphosphatase [Fimbriimonadaceae bacterium]|nr:UDP-2,3-diacylglucosamine diphosphatase [Fimbriimonadaceae bacterium]
MSVSPSHVRAAFVSDIHLGSHGCKSARVQDFLRSYSYERLYLVGDLIDGWVGKQDKKWKQEHTDVIRTILGAAKRGCQIFYTPGNHDDFVRRLNGGELGNVVIDHSFIHTTADGKSFLVVHGDLFDASVTKYRPLAYIGAYMNEYLAVINTAVNKNREAKGKRPLDMAASVKKGVKSFIAKKSDYEGQIIAFAREGGFDGVICGHVHRPRISVEPDGFVYVNTGDWVEHSTGVVEHDDGRLELVWWTDPDEQADEALAAPLFKRFRTGIK